MSAGAFASDSDEGAGAAGRGRLPGLHAVTAALASAHTRAEVAHAVFGLGLAPLGACAGSISLLEDGRALRAVWSFGASAVCGADGPVPLGAPVPLAEAVRTRAPVLLGSREAIGARHPALLEGAIARGEEAWAALPLEVDHRIIGALAVAFAGPRAFGAELRGDLAALGDTCAQALERARLYEEAVAIRERLEEARSRAELLALVAGELNRGVDLGSVLRTALVRAVALLGGDDGSLWVLEEGGAVARCAFEHRAQGREGVRVTLADHPSFAAAIARHQPRWIARAAAAGAEAAWYARLGLSGTICAPLCSEDRCHGVLVVSWAEPRPGPRPEDVAFAGALADQAALAAERAEAFEAERAARRRAEAAEAEARRLGDRLAASQEVTAALASAGRVDDVLDAILEKGLRAFRARAAVVKLADGEGLSTAAIRGYPPAALAPVWRLAPDARAPTADAFRTGEPVWLGTRAAIAAAYPALVPIAETGGDAAWAAIPLVVHGRPIGAIGLAFAGEMTFDAEDRAFVVSLCRKCAHALDRARLHEAERAARAEAESLALQRARALEEEARARGRAEVAEAEARRIGALQEQLIAVVGHDLRTPLSVITLGARMLARAALDEGAARTVRRIDASAVRMSEMIRDLLDFSRARRGQGIPVEPAEADLAEAVRGAVAEARAAYPGREIRLTVEGDVRLRADAARIQQVASNLVVNAVEHGPAEAPVTVVLAGAAEEVTLSVHNEGPPIPEPLRDRLFEPFVRDGGDEGGHLGLGLFIVREIVRAHRGAVEVRSRAGEGTTFAVHLPRHAGPRAPGATPP